MAVNRRPPPFEGTEKRFYSSFTNRHQIHNYYFVAIAVMGIAAAGLGIGSLLESGRTILGAVLLVCLCASQLTWYYTGYHRAQIGDQDENPLYVVAREAKRLTAESDALIVIGTDWSSEIPYYAERKSLTLPYWIRAPEFVQMLGDPSRHLGGRRLGGVVFCNVNLGAYGAAMPAIIEFVRDRSILAKASYCYLLAPEK